MALTISQSGSANSTTSSATLVVTLSQAISVGDMLVVCVAADNQGGGGAPSIASVTDSKSHTYTSRASQNQDPGTASSGASVAIFTAPVTTAMTTSDTVTVNFSPNTTSKAAVIWEVVAGATEFPKYLSNGGSTGNTANPSLLSSSIGSGDAVIYALAAESNATLTGDSDTTNGSWSTLYTDVGNTGTSLTSMRVGSQNKVVSATGTQTWNTTITASDWAVSYIVIDPAPRVERTASGSGTGSQTSVDLHTVFRTATGSGTSSESADDQLVHTETATGSGTGTESATWSIESGVETFSRTATGSGVGSGEGDVDLVHIRAATGSGAGTSTAVGIHIHDRSATNGGFSSSTIVHVVIVERTATGSAIGTQTVSSLRTVFVTATGSGVGTQTVVGARLVTATATGSGSASQSAATYVNQLRLSKLTDFSFPYRFGGSFYLGVVTASRTATGTGTGTETTVSVATLLRTASNSSTGSQTAVGVRVVVRTATNSGSGSQSATPLTVKVRTAINTATGSSTTSILKTAVRTATDSGVGTQLTESFKTIFRTITDAAEGTQTAVGARLRITNGTGSGLGTASSDWDKSHIFRVPYTYNYPGGYFGGGDAANRLGRYDRSGVRARNLYKLTDGTYTTVDQRDQGQVVKLWAGGRNHFLTDEEVVELTAAGFGASIT